MPTIRGLSTLRAAVLANTVVILALTTAMPQSFAQNAASGPQNDTTRVPVAGSGLGRLFYTPERRKALDQQRLSNRPAEKQVESQQLSFDGLVQRSSGKRTVWVNGRALTEHDSNVLGVSTRSGDAGRARISIPNEGGYQMAVGSQVNRETGETSSPLKGGRIQVLSRP